MSFRAFLSLKEDIWQGWGWRRAWASPGKGTAWQYTTNADSSGDTCDASLACGSHCGIRDKLALVAKGLQTPSPASAEC